MGPSKPGAGGDDDLAPVPLERQLSNASYLSTVSLGKEDDAQVKKEREPSSFAVKNPGRVLPAQMRFLSVDGHGRYTPVASSRDMSGVTGIVVLRNSEPEAPQDVVKIERIAIGQGLEADMPAPFEWDPSVDDTEG